MSNLEIVPVDVSSNGIQITRSDLASVVAVYKRDSKRLNLLGAAGMGAGAILGLGAVLIGQFFGMSDDWIPFMVIAMYAIGAASLVTEWVYRRRTVERLQISCLSCGEPLLGSGWAISVVRRAESAVATGNCVTCGHSFISDQQTKGA